MCLPFLCAHLVFGSLLQNKTHIHLAGLHSSKSEFWIAMLSFISALFLSLGFLIILRTTRQGNAVLEPGDLTGCLQLSPSSPSVCRTFWFSCLASCGLISEISIQ